MRWMLVILAIALVAVQGRLWLSADGLQKTRDLRAAVVAQQRQNQFLRERNEALDAEVLNLKHGREAAEERARTDLGMIGRTETFFQVTASDERKIAANASNP
jgi:cell division protein FtsB